MRPSAKGHTKRMCELLASTRVGRYLRQGTNCLVVDWEAVRREEHYDGKWVITSNDDTLTAEDLALGYKQLMRVEECWRQLKTGLRMRPVYHWRPLAHRSACDHQHAGAAARTGGRDPHQATLAPHPRSSGDHPGR